MQNYEIIMNYEWRIKDYDFFDSENACAVLNSEMFHSAVARVATDWEVFGFSCGNRCCQWCLDGKYDVTLQPFCRKIIRYDHSK